MDDFLILQAKLRTLRDIFRPSAPTDTFELFRGRQRQLESVQAGLAGLGEHIMVYGERGVGKTSLAYIAQAIFDGSTDEFGLSVRVQCTDGATFTDVWQEFYLKLVAAVSRRDKAFREFLSEALDLADEVINYPNGDLGATQINRVLTSISSKCELLVIFDEFDRLGAWDETTPFGDLIKGLSDDRLQVTLLLVGVADSIDGLIKSHKSTARNLRQVPMPRMVMSELTAIAEKGFASYSEKSGHPLAIEPDAAKFIAHIAQGFPYYVHLLCGAAGAEAIKAGNTVVTRNDVLSSMINATEDADHDIRSAFTAAVTGRADSNLDLTLYACARASVDDLGYFSSTDVAAALSAIVGSKRAPGNVNAHLRRFSESPCWLLEMKQISERKLRYRFSNPLMKPFALVKGYQTGKLKPPAPSSIDADGG